MAPPEKRKRSTSIRFRVTEAEEEELKQAADKAGLTLSAWIRLHLLRTARQERGEPG